jgi:hypothetical protein
MTKLLNVCENFLCKLSCLFDSFGRAKAASHLARLGHHEAAKRLMLNEGDCKC